MEILFAPSVLLLLIICGIAAFSITSIILKKSSVQKKFVSIAVLLIILISILYFFFRPTSLTVSDTGINSTTYSKISIKWEDIIKAEYIKNYKDTEYKTGLKINGSSIANFKSGTYALKNGEKAKVIIQSSTDAIIIKTKSGLYVFALDAIDEFTKEIKKYIPVTSDK